MDGSRALDRFADYRDAACALEAIKEESRTAGSVRPCLIENMRVYESIMDAAWDEVGTVACGLSDDAARILAEHYLFCEEWESASAICGMSLWKAKKLAYAALEWLDALESKEELL